MSTNLTVIRINYCSWEWAHWQGSSLSKKKNCSADDAKIKVHLTELSAAGCSYKGKLSLCYIRYPNRFSLCTHPLHREHQKNTSQVPVDFPQQIILPAPKSVKSLMFCQAAADLPQVNSCHSQHKAGVQLCCQCATTLTHHLWQNSCLNFHFLWHFMPPRKSISSELYSISTLIFFFFFSPLSVYMWDMNF